LCDSKANAIDRNTRSDVQINSKVWRKVKDESAKSRGITDGRNC